MPDFIRRSWSLLIVAALAATLPGCGPDRPTTVPVRGRITFKGGPPPAAGNVNFAPLKAAEGYTLRPGYGSFDETGEVVATSFTTDDGLLPGRYEVKIECWRVPPSEDSPGESYLPANYVPEELEVSPTDKTVEFTVDVH
jgi:hypothetical protein